jgi:ADP-ribose pyrophosphatase YjhB (NUDIX family)
MREKLQSIGNKTTCPIAIIIRDNKVLMGYRHYTPDKWKTISVWTCPGGRCDEGELIENTLRREVEEETGIKNLEIVDYISDAPGSKQGDTVLMFLCKTDQDATLMEPEKFSNWKWVGANDVPNNFINSRVNTAILELLSRN